MFFELVRPHLNVRLVSLSMAGVELPPAVNDGDVSESGEEKPLNVEDPGRDAHLRPTEPVQFMEIFSNPRIAPEVRRLGQTCGPSIDLGTGWDLTKKAVQQRLLQLLYVLQPLVLMLCPPCTVFSCVQNTMRDRRADYKKWEKQYAEGLCLFKFALLIFRLQVQAGRKVVLEHPWRASSWTLACTQNILALQDVFQTVFDQCLLGLRTLQTDQAVRKRTVFMTNWTGLCSSFSTRCTPATCNHFPSFHAQLQGAEGGMSRTRAAQTYPLRFCQNFAQSVFQEHLRQQVQAPALPQDVEEVSEDEESI